MFRLGLLENAFIIYETFPKPWHDLVISPPIKNNLSIFFLPEKSFVPSWEAFFWKKSSYTLEGSTMYTDYFETIVDNYYKINILTPNNFV